MSVKRYHDMWLGRPDPSAPGENYLRTWRRLRAIFEGRCRQMDQHRESWDGKDYTLPYPVTKYSRARANWRAIRGWL